MVTHTRTPEIRLPFSEQASFDEKTFEVAFEMKDAARKVASRAAAGADGAAAKGPMWKQIQEGASLE